MFIKRNYNLWVDVNKICNKKEIRAYYSQLNFTKKAFGQKYVDYLGSTFYNSMPIYTKKMYFMTYEI